LWRGLRPGSGDPGEAVVEAFYMAGLDKINLGRYRVLEKLGSGAMGVVYKAFDEKLERHVAIKTFSLEGMERASALSGNNEATQDLPVKQKTVRLETASVAVKDDATVSGATLELFFEEAKIAAKLSHPNICAIYDIGSSEDVNFFVMEYVEGDTLETLITSGAEIALATRLSMLSKLARAIHYAHVSGIIHRDIKPANIIIRRDGEPKIMDFGIAKLHTGKLIGRSKVSAIFGTPLYMSPEQIRGDDVDGRSDIFSLGVVAYRFLTGRQPFDGKTLEEIFKNILNRQPAPPSSIAEDIPAGLDRIIFNAMEKDRERRYRLGNELSDSLELLLNDIERGAEVISETASENKEIIRSLKKKYIFFADFHDDEIVAIFSMASKEKFKSGETIFKEGVLGCKFYIVISGRISVFKEQKTGESVEIRTLKEGDCFGEMAIIDNSPRSATAQAVTDVSVLAINDAVLRTNHPHLSIRLYKNLASIIAEKLRVLTARHHELEQSCKSVKA
jgi:serine/threonine-protein kinase